MSSDRALLPVPESRAAAPATSPRRKTEKRGFPARWVFLSTMVSTMLGASIIGSALAFTGSQYSPENQVQVGYVQGVVTYESNGSPVGPADGQFRPVGTGGVANAGTFNIRYKEGAVELTGINGAGDECSLSMFHAQLHEFVTLHQQIRPAFPIPLAFRVDVAALPGSAQTCDGATLSFNLNFTFQSFGGNPNP